MTDQTEEKAPEYEPALFVHCRTFYNAMLAASEEKAEGLTFTGNTTALFNECGLNMGQYTAITRRLQEMGCIQQIRRGGGPSPSVWRLLGAPDLDLFLGSSGSALMRKPHAGTKAHLAQQMRDLEMRLSVVESYLRREGAPI